MFCLGVTVGRRIGDPCKMRHLAAKSADSMLLNLPHCNHLATLYFIHLFFVPCKSLYFNFQYVNPDPSSSASFSPPLSACRLQATPHQIPTQITK
jgi:hypothetical protein